MRRNGYSRREFMKAAGFGAIFGAASCHAAAVSPGGRRPNILFIMSDDHASHAMSCYGSVINKTPQLDRIAQAGMRLDNCFCTNSICAPSRANILTGKYSHKNGVLDNRLKFDGSQQTFPKLLGQAGYQTAMIGKWHLKTLPTGFDYYNVLPGQGLYHDPVFIEAGEKKTHPGYVTDLITDFTIDYLAKRNQEKPFCVMCHHKAPHRRWEPDEAHATMYDDIDVPKPETYDDDYSTRGTAAHNAEMRMLDHLTVKDVKSEFPEGLSDEELKHWKYQRYIKDYLRVIASVDDNVGRLLDYLDENGLAGNTLVIYTSDQGFYLGDHGWFDKRFMYEHSLRMPFIARLPGVIPAGSTGDAMVLNVDFAPTFLDYAGVAVPDDIQGESARGVLEGDPPKKWRTSMYYQYYEYPGAHMVRRHYGVRTGRHKLMYFYGVDEWELYDLERDPNELQNVYGDPANAGLIKKLKRELERHRRELDVPEDKEPRRKPKRK